MTSNVSECIICFCRLQGEPCKDPQYFTSVFDTFCHLLEINLIQGIQWNFEQDGIPFCKFCCSTVERLKRLYDQLNLIEKDIAYILEATKYKILFNSGSARNVLNELDGIDRVSYIRQQAVRGTQVVESPVNEITNPKEETDVFIKIEPIEEETNENTSSCFHGIKERPTFQKERDANYSVDGASNDRYFDSTFTTDNGFFSGDPTGDSELHFIKSEANAEIVETSRSTSDVVISDPDGSYKCSYCEKTFRRKRSLRLHLKCHLEEQNYDEIVETGNTSELHGADIHPSEGAFKCGACHKGFYSENELQRHVATHNQVTQYKCDLCGRCFFQSAYLKYHQIIHATEKPYKCKMCTGSFDMARQLNRHKRIHTGERPYKCDICGRCFRIKTGLTCHIRYHTGEKPFKCDSCEKSFAHKIHLRNHIRMHSGEMLYECEVCDRCFSEEHKLISHAGIHDKEKRYNCDQCGYRFIDAKDFERHVKIHAGEKSYKCDSCEETFRKRSHLKIHMKMHSGEGPASANATD